MRINVNKSVCIRFGQGFDIQCVNLITDGGDELNGLKNIGILA